MKVLLFNEFTRIPGGTDQIVNHEHELLRETGLSCLLYVLYNSHILEGSFFERSRFMLSSLSPRLILREFQGIINKYRPDIIHFHNIYQLCRFPLWNFIDPGNAKMILHLHNYYPFCLNSFMFNKGYCNKCLNKNNWVNGIINKCYDSSYLRSFYSAINRLSGLEWIRQNNRISRLISVSKYTRDVYISAGICPDKITVLQNFMSGNSVHSDTPGNYILFLGSIRIEKGIEIFCRCAEENPNIKFIACGNGKDLPGMKIKYAHLKNLYFTGYVEGETKKNLLRKMRFLMVPSLCAESFGLIVLEAYKYGRPVLCYKSGALPEIVEEGMSGRFIKKDPSAEASSFWNELESRTAYYSSECNRIFKLYTGERHIKELLSIYKSVLS